MLGLITDRSQVNVDRRNALAKKGWYNMTADEQAEWSGNPFLASGGVNLIPKGVNYASGVTIKYRNDSIVAVSEWDGTYIYAILVLGAAANFEGKTMTLSLDGYYSSGGGTPQAALYWHDTTGYEFAGASLTEAGSVTFTASENTGAREYLALYLYTTTDASITAGAFIRYDRLMLEMGSIAHSYVPHYGVLPTAATKGAYNYSDFNRVEAAVAELAELASFSLETKIDWSAWDLPTEADTIRILGNIGTLRFWFALPDEIPATPSTMNNMTYETANNIEKIIEALAGVIDAEYRSGDLYSGEA